MQNNIFSCEYCDFTTKRKYNLQRHQIAFHISNIINDKKDIINDKKDIINDKKDIINNKKDIINDKKDIINDKKDIQSINEYFNCTKCNKIYKTKKSLINHEKNCIGINSLTCPRCMKGFTTYGNKSRHIKNDNCKAKSIIHSSNNNITPNININGNNNIINNNYINNFGSERTDYITYEDMYNILRLSGNNVIPKYIEMKHFNKDFPENHNIKYEKNNNCLIKKNGEWRITNIEHLSNNLIDKNSNEIRNYYNDNKTKINNSISDIDLIEFIFKKFNYLDLCLDKKLYTNIKDEIKEIIRSTTI
jgi:uncharacterized C2H2 Zn-finger protein